jgi:hypothetical protein
MLRGRLRGTCQNRLICAQLTEYASKDREMHTRQGGALQEMTLRDSWALAQMASCGQLTAPAVPAR